jgi:hypothetical protein
MEKSKPMKIVLDGDPEPLEVTEGLLWAEVLPRVMPFSTSLYVGEEREDTQPAPCGSATFVFADGPSVLTAAHVWERIRQYKWLFMALDSVSMPSARHPLAVPVEGLTPRFVSRRLSDDWGPDVALIGVPEPHAGKITLSKAFYHLDRRRTAALTSTVRLQEGLWAVIGAVHEQSEFGPDESVVRPTVFASTISGTAERDGYDYLEHFLNREGKPSRVSAELLQGHQRLGPLARRCATLRDRWHHRPWCCA